MSRKRKITIPELALMLQIEPPPASLGEVAARAGFTRTNPICALLSEESQEAPYGWEIVWVPKLRKKGITQNAEIS